MVKKQALASLPHAILFIMDQDSGTVPTILDDTTAAATLSCIAVGTTPSMDGDVEVLLEIAPHPTGVSDPATIDLALFTPSRHLAVVTSEAKVILESALPTCRTRVRVATNHPSTPSEVRIVASPCGSPGETSKEALRYLARWGRLHPSIPYPVVTVHALADDPEFVPDQKQGEIPPGTQVDLWWLHEELVYLVSIAAGRERPQVTYFHFGGESDRYYQGSRIIVESRVPILSIESVSRALSHLVRALELEGLPGIVWARG